MSILGTYGIQLHLSINFAEQKNWRISLEDLPVRCWCVLQKVKTCPSIKFTREAQARVEISRHHLGSRVGIMAPPMVDDDVHVCKETSDRGEYIVIAAEDPSIYYHKGAAAILINRVRKRQTLPWNNISIQTQHLEHSGPENLKNSRQKNSWV